MLMGIVDLLALLADQVFGFRFTLFHRFLQLFFLFQEFHHFVFGFLILFFQKINFIKDRAIFFIGFNSKGLAVEFNCFAFVFSDIAFFDLIDLADLLDAICFLIECVVGFFFSFSKSSILAGISSISDIVSFISSSSL